MKKLAVILSVATAGSLLVGASVFAQPPAQPPGTWQCFAYTSRAPGKNWYWFNASKAVAISKARNACYAAGYSPCQVSPGSCSYKPPQVVRWSCTAYNARGVPFSRWGYAPQTNAIQNALNLCRSSRSTYNPNTCHVPPGSCVILTN